jgi:hypothetical protein
VSIHSLFHPETASVFEFGEALHVDSLDLSHTASTVSRKRLALSVAGLRFRQQFSNPSWRSLFHVSINVFQGESETRADWCFRIFRIDRLPQFVDHHTPVKLVEIADVTSCEIAKPRGISQTHPWLRLHVTIEGDRGDGNTERSASRTVHPAISVWFASEGLVHGIAQCLWKSDSD